MLAASYRRRDTRRDVNVTGDLLYKRDHRSVENMEFYYMVDILIEPRFGHNRSLTCEIKVLYNLKYIVEPSR